jgi:hypothetical protein
MEVKLAEDSRMNYYFLAYLSRPKADRKLYRMIKRSQVIRIVEIGIASLSRTQRMLRVAADLQGAAAVRYTGIDPYDDRPAGDPPLALKDVYQRLRATGAQIRLVPGSPLAALARTANLLPRTDLLVLSARIDTAALQGAWFYVPRMLHSDSLVVREETTAMGRSTFRTIPYDEIEQWAGTARRRLAA